jgi:dihydrolipoamide dehydrogenase
MGELRQETEVLVIGGGPGGYSAAFRAADLGMEVTMVDLSPRPGGMCLHRGCIPSKTLLYAAHLIADARRAGRMGIDFQPPTIDINGLRGWKDSVVDQLAGGLEGLCAKRGVQRLQGRAVFEKPDTVRLYECEVSHLRYRWAILATGSRPRSFPGMTHPQESRIMTSTAALGLTSVPERLLVIGGGYVGLELGSVWAVLGSRVTVVENGERLLAAADPDLVGPLQRWMADVFDSMLFQTSVQTLEEQTDKVRATLTDSTHTVVKDFDKVLVAIGHHPNTRGLELDKAGIMVTPEGFVRVDDQQRTANPKVFAVGDVVGGVMLAHKALREGKVAAEAIAGKPSRFDVAAIPAVVYTDPQVAWAGLTEKQAKAAGRPVAIQRFPWRAAGRATTMGLEEGLTKIISDPQTGRILGMGMVGRDTEGLIAEAVLAIEMGALVEDLALTMHPHPTLSETEAEAAELFLGTATHVLNLRR